MSGKASTGSLLDKGYKPSEMQRSERPGDRLTIEEMRLDLCAKIGPYRIHAGKPRIFTIDGWTPTLIATGRGPNKVPSFIRIEMIAKDKDGNDYQPFDLLLSNQPDGAFRPTNTFSAYVDVILLAGENLYASKANGTQPGAPVEIKVTEVTV